MGLVIFGTMFLVSLYIWAAYYVERFAIKGTMLWVRSIFQNRQFDVSELQRLKWRALPRHGSIDFYVLGSKTRLGFTRIRIGRSAQNHSSPARMCPPGSARRLAPLLPEGGLALRDGEPQPEYEPTAELRTITRERYDRLLVLGMPVMVALATVLWAWSNAWQFFALPVLFLAGELLLRFNVPPEGRREPTVTSTPQGRAALILYFAAFSMMLVMIGFPLLGFGKRIALGTAYAVMAGIFPPVIYSAIKADKRRRAAESQTVDLAPAIWQEGESCRGQQCRASRGTGEGGAASVGDLWAPEGPRRPGLRP